MRRRTILPPPSERALAPVTLERAGDAKATESESATWRALVNVVVETVAPPRRRAA